MRRDRARSRLTNSRLVRVPLTWNQRCIRSSPRKRGPRSRNKRSWIPACARMSGIRFSTGSEHEKWEPGMSVKPRIKLDKKEATKGDIVEVKALVSHVMESGQRKDSAGNTIPRKILNKFTCTVNGKQVFAADFEPAISANPYIQFKFRAQESGPVVLT